MYRFYNQPVYYMKEILFSILCFVSFSIYGFSHGDLDQRIINATTEIKEDPENATLYFKRGKLYFQHEEYKNSVLDLSTAETKGYNEAELYLFTSKSYFALNDLDNADKALKKFYAIDSQHIVAHKLEAQIEVARGNFQRSALLFEYVIDHANVTLPENYIDAASSWLATNTNDGLDKAITILKRGLSDIGPLYTLNLKIIDSYVEYKSYENAIEHLESIISSRKRKESSYYKLYELYTLLGNDISANQSLKNALKSWNMLPQRVKKNSAMIALHDNIQNKLTAKL